MTAIASCIAIISTIGFLTLWFLIVKKEMIVYKSAVDSAKASLESYHEIYSKSRESPRECDAYNVLKIGSSIYSQAVDTYNTALKKALNTVPAFLMGYRKSVESQLLTMTAIDRLNGGTK